MLRESGRGGLMPSEMPNILYAGCPVSMRDCLIEVWQNIGLTSLDTNNETIIFSQTDENITSTEANHEKT